MPRDSYLHRGALPETPGLTWGAGVGGGRRGRGQSSLAGRGRGATRSPDDAALTSPGRAGARSAWVAGLGVGGPGGRRPPPGPGFAVAATCLHRDQLLPPLRREGEGAGPWSRRSPWPIGAQHANEGARHSAASAGWAALPLLPARAGPEMRLQPAVLRAGGRAPSPVAPLASHGPWRGTYPRDLTWRGVRRGPHLDACPPGT